MSNLSRNTRIIFWLILAFIVAIGLFSFFNSGFGQYALLCCCGGIVVIIVVAIVSEMGMSRRS
jgi:hypothetical protein